MGRNVGRLQNKQLTLRVRDHARFSPSVSQRRLHTHRSRLPHSKTAPGAALVLPLAYPCASETEVTSLQAAVNARSS